MAFTYRKSPVVELPFKPQDQSLADLLQRTLGKLVSLSIQPLFDAQSQISVGTAGSTVFIPGGLITINLADAGIDEVRLIGYGHASNAAASFDVFSSTQSKILCAATGLPGADGAFAGNWTKITPLNADEVIGARLTLPAAATSTISRLEMQMRSSHFIG